MLALGEYKNMIAPIKYVRINKILQTYPFSMHEHFEILYVRRGSVVVTINEKEYLLSEGDMSFATPFACHRIHASDDVLLDVFLPSPQICRDVEKIFLKNIPLNPVLKKDEIPTVIKLLYDNISKEITDTFCGEDVPDEFVFMIDTNQAELLGHYVSVILLELKKCLPMKEIESSDLSVAQKVLSYCADNYLTDISRDSLAEACGISTNAASQIFAKLGTSFREYINSLRITTAYSMLCSTDLSIKEIMNKCGYYNQGTFNQNFINQYGKAPRELRSELKKVNK